MKQLITFFFVGFYIFLSAQPDVNEIKALLKDYNSYQVFVLQPLDSTFTEKYILEIGADVWETQYIKTTDLIKEQGLEEQIQSSKTNSIVIQVAPSTLKLIRRRNSPRDYCNPSDYYQFSEKNGVYLMVVEVPAHYETLEIVSILENGECKNIVKQEKIAIRKFIRHGNIRIVPAEGYVKSNDYESCEIYGGEWSEVKQYFMPHCGYSTNNKITQIQRKLVKLGYEIKVDGVLGSHMRNALVDYQRKNGLPEGRLDIETLKHLGVYN